MLFVLFGVILYVQVNNFSAMTDRSSLVEPVSKFQHIFVSEIVFILAFFLEQKMLKFRNL